MDEQSASSRDQNSPKTSASRTTSPVAALKFAHQAGKLSHKKQDSDGKNSGGAAVEAHFVTPQDSIIVTANGGRLPGPPLAEAIKLNDLRVQIGYGEEEDVIAEGHADEHADEAKAARKDYEDMSPSSEHSESQQNGYTKKSRIQKSGEGSLRKAMPPSRTNPLFPPLPLYGPSSFTRDMQVIVFRTISFFLSLTFLGVIVLGALFTSIGPGIRRTWLKMTFRNPDKKRPFWEEELRLEKLRKEENAAWKKKSSRRKSVSKMDDAEDDAAEEFIPTEGGADPLVCDVGYYARRVGLDVEDFEVQTEDGFVIDLWHVYDPKEYTPMTAEQRAHRGPEAFANPAQSEENLRSGRKKKYPVLMIHGLLQSSGAYCTNDDKSLAFYLCKAGYDVWLGNNRCGFKPKHTLLSYNDPRMWAWNIRQMGVMDLPALVSRVLSETNFPKLGLICHSQGTTQTFVALAKEQRPDLGEKISVFCALAPAAYAGPLIGKAYFKFMRLISPAFFRLCFGIHAFIPFMMTMHTIIPGKLFGVFGYRVFSFLFNWSDTRWDRGLRDRCFQFAPVYVSAEAMRWWLGRECFASQKCILATREAGRQEDVEDEEEDYYAKSQRDQNADGAGHDSGARTEEVRRKHSRKPKGSTAWYDSRAPPFALWVAGSDDLVDGRRLLRRFERGREPHVDIVHSKIIPEYEHLDVIWAIDMIEQVGREVKEVLWKTCPARERCRVPLGCEDVSEWQPKKKDGEDGEEDEKIDAQHDENATDASADESSQSSSAEETDEKDGLMGSRKDEHSVVV